MSALSLLRVLFGFGVTSGLREAPTEGRFTNPPLLLAITRDEVLRNPGIRGLPAGTVVRASARARRKGLGRALGTAGADGASRLAIKLSKKARRMLRNPKLKRISLRVAVTPPGQARSSVARTVKLKR